ncbi:MAG: hypothetical protein ACYCU0_06370 [Solirubrobacteraceae bacterium]
MDLDGQAIERRDFPISRRGYEPAAVDAHLRELAAAVRSLQGELRSGVSVGESAGGHVQGVLDAAEAAAAQIVREAKARASEELEAAAREAERMRSEALTRADAHTAAVSEAASALRQRLGEMEAQLEALTGTLVQGGSELTAGVEQLRSEMGRLYDAASGRARATEGQAAGAAGRAPKGAEAALAGADDGLLGAQGTLPTEGVGEVDERVPRSRRPPVRRPARDGGAPPAGKGEPVELTSEEEHAPPAPTGSAREITTSEEHAPEGSSAGGERSKDVDGARLIALNMALNGDSREQTDLYLAERFDLAEREKLVDEVFAAIEG